MASIIISNDQVITIFSLEGENHVQLAWKSFLWSEYDSCMRVLDGHVDISTATKLEFIWRIKAIALEFLTADESLLYSHSRESISKFEIYMII